MYSNVTCKKQRERYRVVQIQKTKKAKKENTGKEGEGRSARGGEEKTSIKYEQKKEKKNQSRPSVFSAPSLSVLILFVTTISVSLVLFSV